MNIRLWEEIKRKMLYFHDRKIREKSAEISYGELVDFAEGFASGLNKPCYGIMCGSEMAAGMALLACFAAGVTAVPLSLKYGEKHCRKIIDTVKMPAVITDNGGKLHTVDIDSGEYTEPKQRPALIMCTSGTTGTPKGVMLSEKNILSNLHDIEKYFKITCDDTILIERPLYHCAVLTGEFLVSLSKGLNIVFSSEAFDPLALLRLIRENTVTVMCGTPTLFSALSHFIRGEAGSSMPLRVIAVSGEAMNSTAARKLSQAFPKTRIYHVYGQTEASPRISYLPPDLFSRYPLSVGIPLDSVNIKILDEDGNEAVRNEVGEVTVSGENVMLGYFNDPEKSSSVIKNGRLYTGDYGYIDQNGLLYIKGRMDDLIIRAGMNIYPAEIESALEEDERVRDALVYGVSDGVTQKLALNISGDFTSVEEVKKLCREKLEAYQMPSFTRIVDEIPKNASGKKIRKA